MPIADRGRIFRLAVPNKTAATTIPAKNAIESTADCCVMQYLYSHRAQRADIRPRKEMAAARRQAPLPGFEQRQNALGPPGALPSDTRMPIRQMTSRGRQQMQPSS